MVLSSIKPTQPNEQLLVVSLAKPNTNQESAEAKD
jgi:hypothetical protein